MPSSRPPARLDFGSARNWRNRSVDRLYRSKKFENDDEQVAKLLERHQK